MFKIEVFGKGRGKMMTAAQAYAYTKRFEEAYTAAMRPLCDELGAAQSAVDVLMFLANNPELNTAGDICKYRRLKPGIVSCRVDELVNDGYLERSAVPGDRRKCRSDHCKGSGISGELYAGVDPRADGGSAKRSADMP